jgi:hypothetical protein
VGYWTPALINSLQDPPLRPPFSIFNPQMVDWFYLKPDTTDRFGSPEFLLCEGRSLPPYIRSLIGNIGL